MSKLRSWIENSTFTTELALVYLLSTRVDFSFSVHKLARFPSNLGKSHFEGLVHILRYIMYNKTLGLMHYTDMNDSPVSEC